MTITKTGTTTMTRSELEIVAESIRAALVEIEQCPDISQGVEDDLRMSLDLLEEYKLEEQQTTNP